MELRSVKMLSLTRLFEPFIFEQPLSVSPPCIFKRKYDYFPDKMNPPPAKKKMSSRERFRETMGYGTPDRVPYFEEGIRSDVLAAWRTQGLTKDTDLANLFPCDHRERIEVDLEPRPKLLSRLDKMTDLKKFARRLNPSDKARLPNRWPRRVRAWQEACMAHEATGQVTREEIVKLYYDYALGAGNGALVAGRAVSSFAATFPCAAPPRRAAPRPPRRWSGCCARACPTGRSTTSRASR